MNQTPQKKSNLRQLSLRSACYTYIQKKYRLVVQNKLKLKLFILRTSPGFVFSHKCTFRKELADDLTKQITQKSTTDTHLAVCQSYIKNILRSRIFILWQSTRTNQQGQAHTNSLLKYPNTFKIFLRKHPAF